MHNFTEGETAIFEDVAEKIHSSKKAEIFSGIITQKKWEKAHPKKAKEQ